MSKLKPVMTKQFLVVLDGVSAKFSKCSGISETRDSADYDDGETGQTFTHLGFIKLEEVTLSKTFDPVADKALVDWWVQQKKAPTDFTVTIQPVQADTQGTAISGSRALILQGCQVSSFRHAEVDRTGSGIAMLEIRVYPKAVTYQ